MEVFNCPSMKSIPAICIALVLSAVAGEAPQAFEIALDPGAGNPAAAVGGEPKPNGGRINLGRFGGTDQASLSKRIGLIILMR